ncbi:MAG: hypothetical protein HQK54_10905 [Oligoflexales bacterium]|nr:hypothetical protein [Oligoflexales bacterium]
MTFKKNILGYETMHAVFISIAICACAPFDMRNPGSSYSSTIKASDRTDASLEKASYKGPLEFRIYHGDLISDLKKKFGNDSKVLTLVNGAQDSIDDVNQLEPAAMNSNVVWPTPPRAIYNSDTGVEFAFSVHLGYEGSVLDIVNVAAVNTMTLTQRVVKQLFLIKHTAHGTEQMLTTAAMNSPDGEKISVIKPDVSDGGTYVGLCVHTLNFETSNKFLSSLKIAGNGFTSTTLSIDKISLAEWSSYFNIDDNDTLTSLENLCKESFTEKVRRSLADDMKKAIIAKYELSFDPNGNTAEATAVNSILYGPETKRLKLKGHHWNFRKGKIVKSGDTVTLGGSFMRSIRGLRDDQVNYSCSVKDPLNFETSVSFIDRSLQKNYKNAARDLVKMFCHDAYVECIDYVDGEY